MDVYLCHPLLVPQNIERTLYHGFLKVNKQAYEIALELKESDSFKSASISCEWKLKHLLKGFEHLLTKRVGECESLQEVLTELRTIVERELKGSKLLSEIKSTPSYYKDLVTQLEEIGWQRLKYIDTDLQQIHLTCEDTKDREHVLKLQLHPQHPELSPQMNVDLPEKFQVSWSQKVDVWCQNLDHIFPERIDDLDFPKVDVPSTLSDVCAAFTEKLSIYQDLWDCLDELDKCTWVLEPESHSYSALYRRIAIGNNASLQITVDARNSRILPECRFLGADHVVNPLRDNLNRNLDLWDSSLGLYHNIQTLLEIELPSRQSISKEEMNLECGICYTYRLEGVLPDSVCEDVRCGQPFHQTCLYEWLRAVPTSRQSFNIIFGECPYCSKSITVKKPL